jgi:hypothetical protein
MPLFNENDDTAATAPDELLIEEHIIAARGLIVSKQHPLFSERATLWCTTARRASSEVDNYGVRVIETSEEGIVKYFFICLAGLCCRENENKGRLVLISKSSTHKATNHLVDVHSIISTKTKSAQKNLNKLATLTQSSAEGFSSEPDRFFEVAFSSWAAEHGISSNAFRSDTWRTIAKFMPFDDKNRLLTLNIPRFIIEQYIHIKTSIQTMIDTARCNYDIPFLSFNLDLYQNSIQNTKYIALRISWDLRGSQYSRNLAIREYNPSYHEREEEQASELLNKWTRAILGEFGIDFFRDVLTGSGDSGSDVKRAMEVLLGTLREWCVSHLINLALVDAFGTSVDLRKSKN